MNRLVEDARLLRLYCNRHCGLLLALSWITSSLSHKDTQATLQRSPHGEELSLPANNQQGTRLSILLTAV